MMGTSQRLIWRRVRHDGRALVEIEPPLFESAIVEIMVDSGSYSEPTLDRFQTDGPRGVIDHIGVRGFMVGRTRIVERGFVERFI